MIRISDLRFAYRGGFELSVPSLEIARGEKLALVGPNQLVFETSTRSSAPFATMLLAACGKKLS